MISSWSSNLSKVKHQLLSPQLWCQEQPNNTKAEVRWRVRQECDQQQTQKHDQCSRWFDSLQLCPLKKITFRKFHKEQKKRNVCPTGGGPLCILDTHMWVIRIWQAGSLLITATLMKTVKNFMIKLYSLILVQYASVSRMITECVNFFWWSRWIDPWFLSLHWKVNLL